jgi:hypothetical protein
MKTTTGKAILNSAAEKAGRTRDKIPNSEQVMLQGFIADEFQTLVNQRAWPDFIPAILNVTAANMQFSKNEGSVDPLAPEIGDVLDVMLDNPQSGTSRCGHIRHVGFYEGDGVVYVDTTETNLYVEYMLPYPGVTFPDMDPESMTLANFMVQIIPLRFKRILSNLAAAHLLTADSNSALAGVRLGLAEKALVAEIHRLPPEPFWRNAVRLAQPPRHVPWSRAC